jgi:hypothetical protein
LTCPWRRHAFNCESSCPRTATRWAMASGFIRWPWLGHRFPSTVLARRGLCENAGKRNGKAVPRYSDYRRGISACPLSPSKFQFTKHGGLQGAKAIATVAILLA